ncbi:MAG: immunoglobulin domain-containing protein [Phycisphaerae bacterium]
MPFASGTWVRALAVNNGSLIVAGTFSTIGSATAENIATYDGANFAAIGTGIGSPAIANEVVNDIEVVGSSIYAVGEFATAGGNAARRVTVWDGSTWSSLGSGPNNGIPSGTVNAVEVIGTRVYVAGSFSTAGTTGSVGNIAFWDGAAWQKLGPSGTNGTISALTEFNGELIVSGIFNLSGGVAVSNVARFDGTTWHAMGSGSFAGLTVHDGVLFGGRGDPFGVQRWNGSAWIDDVTEGDPDDVRSLYSDGVALYAGNNEGQVWKRVDTLKWLPVGLAVPADPGNGMPGAVTSLAIFGGDVYAGGYIFSEFPSPGFTKDLTRFDFNGAGAPTISAQPVDAHVDVNTTLGLSVSVDGSSGDVIYQWYKDGAAIDGATMSSFSIPSATADDAGEYYVEITNLCGTTVSDIATVTIRTPCVGDINEDLEVGLTDLSLLLGSFGLCNGTPGFNAAADLNDTNCVDLTDLSMLLAVFGTECP